MSEKTIKIIFKVFTFIAIVNLPFIVMIQLIGLEEFLDSFEFSDSYNYLKISQYDIDNIQGEYLIFQKATHPNFSIVNGDDILYINGEERLKCKKGYQDCNCGEITKYFPFNLDKNCNKDPLFEYQIIGKVVGIVENNVLNILSLKVWDISINNLNAAALFIND